MPTPLILSYAKRSRKPVHEVEAAWSRAKEQAKGIRRSNIIDKEYWALVNGLMKKELGLNESKVSFKTFLESLGESKTKKELLAMGGEPLSSFQDIIKVPSDGSFWRQKGNVYIRFSEGVELEGEVLQ